MKVGRIDRALEVSNVAVKGKTVPTISPIGRVHDTRWALAAA